MVTTTSAGLLDSLRVSTCLGALPTLFLALRPDLSTTVPDDIKLLFLLEPWPVLLFDARTLVNHHPGFDWLTGILLRSAKEGQWPPAHPFAPTEDSFSDPLRPPGVMTFGSAISGFSPAWPLRTYALFFVIGRSRGRWATPIGCLLLPSPLFFPNLDR